MNRIRTLGTSLVALAALVSVTMAFAQTSETSGTTGTVDSVVTLAMTAGGTIAMSPAVGTPVTDGSTSLDYETNDGQTYKIQVDASVTTGWGFTPNVTGSTANTYPVLTVDAVTDTNAGTLGSGTIIASDNTPSTVDVLSGITNSAGTAGVTLGASVTQTVVSGTYEATLTYNFVSP